MKDKPKVEKAGGMNGGAGGQQEAGDEAEAGPFEDEHGREGWGRESGLDVAAGEEDGRRGKAKE